MNFDRRPKPEYFGYYSENQHDSPNWESEEGYHYYQIAVKIWLEDHPNESIKDFEMPPPPFYYEDDDLPF